MVVRVDCITCVVVSMLLLTVCFSMGCVSEKGVAVTSTTLEHVQKPAAGLDNPPQEGDAVTVRGPERKFHRTLSIVMPAGWREVEYQNMLIYLPPGSEVADPLSEKVTVAVGVLPENNTVPLKDILEDGIIDSRKIVPDLELISEEETSVSGIYAIRMVFSGTIQGKRFENTQISLMRGKILYHLIHNCVKDYCRHGGSYREMVESLEPHDFQENS
ncbi:MAG: hypothetical protein ABIH11_04215 [Candidatus Altiarchaeota archaeon]